jgi:asparagine synthase (glutamine-hydrolysing)
VCGIAGFLATKRDRTREDLTETVRNMAEALIHRGPNDEGVWVDETSGIALGHRRLSVVDLSAHGHQPMLSPTGRFLLDYNGEVYNTDELRRELVAQGVIFRGHSDTEVLAAAIEVWGLERALAAVNGMFAFALWDRKTKELHLCRDRLGEKPLYYASTRSAFVFASELKAMRRFPGLECRVDRRALALYLRHNCIPSPYSIYEGVSKLRPGTVVTVAQAGGRVVEAKPIPYWSARDAAEAGIRQPLQGSTEELTDELERLLSVAVSARMEADVPLGAFLSGGIDSSVVVALMQRHTTGSVKTFTIGFEDRTYDESADAAAIAHHLRTDHTDAVVSPRAALDVIPKLPTIYDEPFADSSQIPTFLVSELARCDVTVALSGDGGDELFAGYNRYVWSPAIWARARQVPQPIRRLAARGLEKLAPATWDTLFARVGSRLPRRMNVRIPAAKAQKLAEVLPARSLEEMYLRLVSHWEDPEVLVGPVGEPPTAVTDRRQWADVDDPVAWMMHLDLVTYLPDDILAKVDRAAMAVSLETRLPMLDHRLVEFAWQIPLEMKIADGVPKWILRRVLERHVPRQLFDRPKMGFGLPLGQWLRGPLRAWAENLLEPSRLRAEGFFDDAVVRRVWDRHLCGDRNLEDELWDVLMFQAWYEASC